jgi:hypothetical protein
MMTGPFFDINDTEGISLYIVNVYKEAYESLGKQRRPEDLLVIHTKLKELTELRHNLSMPIIDLTNKFEELAKDITQKTGRGASVAAAG